MNPEFFVNQTVKLASELPGPDEAERSEIEQEDEKMNAKHKCILVVTLAVLTRTPASFADVAVWFEPSEPTVAVGDTVAVDLMASFESPVVAWGLDLNIAGTSYIDWIGAVVGPAWDASIETLDGDGLAGLRFPYGVSGEVLLATLTFEGLAEGAADLTLCPGVDEDEGFLFDTGDLASNVNFASTTLTVVPEPAGLALLGLGALAAARRRE